MTTPNDNPAALPVRLTYNKRELCAALGLKPTTIYKLEVIGRLVPIPGIRHKIYSRAAVEKFLAGSTAA